MTAFRKAVILASFITMPLLLTIYFNLPNNRQHVVHTPSSRSDTTNETKYILYYTKMFDNDTFYMGQGADIFKNCPVSNCYATSDATMRPIDQYHALLFHGNEYNPFGERRPAVRSTDQIYIWVNMESPANSVNWPSTNFFNWTMTYRWDSDLFRPYGRTKKKHRTYTLPSVDDIKKRPNKIAWVVSNCWTSSYREILVTALRKLMPVDIYGMCGSFVCTKIGNDCFEFIAKNYKFYLAFENSMCEDYVTEKFFRTLQYDIVPVVYGGANYSKAAPPHSFIEANQYESVELLVQHLQELDEDPEKYMQYIEWKKDFVINMDNDDVSCELCKKLHEPVERKIYKEIGRWYDFPNVCRRAESLPTIVLDLL